jgi:hypothetical protein
MRVKDDIRWTVVFFGFEAAPEQGGIDCRGTGFLLTHDYGNYLVTAKHCAVRLEELPFVIRVNKHGGTSEVRHFDHVKWYGHPDPTVDIAVVPLELDYPKWQAAYLHDMLLIADENEIGIGDPTYTIGLFQFAHGTGRNVPVVHKGSIALMPSDEKLPQKNWYPPHDRVWVEGYLVETQALQGLSGSPVFVRPSFLMATKGLETMAYVHPPGQFAIVSNDALKLMGVWSGSWDAPPGDILAANLVAGTRVPVGMGIVVPTKKILETLAHPELIELREERKKRLAAQQADESAKPD